MSKIKSAPEKKALSLERDRRNTFRENCKATRKAIPRRKQLSHMGERRAVSQILTHLRESAGEEDASEADVLAKTIIAEKKHEAFEKTPDTPLGMVVEKKLANRRKQAEPSSAGAVRAYRSFQSVGIFDTPYDPALHRHFILRELRYRTGPAPAFLGRNKKKDERLSKYERHVPFQWKQAILRDAPLLKGFFAEEPKWREKMLRWCDRQLEVLVSLDGKNA